MSHDDKIREILHLEADTVDPSPAGWDAIQQGIAARRARRWWARGTALAGVAAVFLGATVYVAVDRSQRGVEGVPASPGPLTAPPAGTETPGTRPASVVPEPLGAIWPLTTRAELRAWEADNETYPSLRSARGAALAFARTYLGLKDATIDGADRYGESTLVVRNGPLTVTSLTVFGFGREGTAPFVVTRAESEVLRITSPVAGARLSGTVPARGTYEGVEPAIDVRVRADGDGSAASAEETTVRATVGPTGWSANVRTDAARPTGSLLVTNASPRDGSVAAAAAIPVLFGKSVGPMTFVATREGRIALLSSATGELVRWLTGPDSQPGAGSFDAELSEDGTTVVYAQATGNCAGEIRAVGIRGGSPTTVVRDEGALAHPSRNGRVVAYRRTLCEQGGDEQEVVVLRDGRAVERAGVAAAAGPVVSPAGRVAFTSGGGQDEPRVHVVDASDGSSRTTAGPDGCTLGGIAWDGETLFAAASCGPETGQDNRLYRFADGGFDLVASFVMPPVASLDFAGDATLLGTRGHPAMTAYAYVDGALREIPGLAQRPTWSFLGPTGGS